MNWPLYIEGTGKTITGAHLVYFFNRQNQLLPPSGDENQRPQILYCGPSNKSVDVITGKRSSKLSPDSVRVHVYKHLSLLIHLAPVATFHPLLSPAFVIDYYIKFTPMNLKKDQVWLTSSGVTKSLDCLYLKCLRSKFAVRLFTVMLVLSLVGANVPQLSGCFQK